MLEGKYMSIADVAEVLNVSESTVKSLCQKGKLISYKIGNQWRIDPADFHDYLESVKHGSKSND